jgi:ATP synthase protein I
MFRVVVLQVLATLVVALLAAVVSGRAAAMSALLGGAACFVPNGLFALRLAAASRSGRGGIGTFFVGEFVKVGSTVALIALIAWSYRDVVWPALVFAVIAALKSYLIALIWRP